MSSAELGITAKLDVVEVDRNGTVVPVDYKKGRPGPDGRPRETDRVQSIAQVMLLRAAGYESPRAEVWYDETRQRVEIPVDERAVAKVDGHFASNACGGRAATSAAATYE